MLFLWKRFGQQNFFHRMDMKAPLSNWTSLAVPKGWAPIISWMGLRLESFTGEMRIHVAGATKPPEHAQGEE